MYLLRVPVTLTETIGRLAFRWYGARCPLFRYTYTYTHVDEYICRISNKQRKKHRTMCVSNSFKPVAVLPETYEWIYET